MAYLQNSWYVGAYGHELTTQPLRRVLLDQPVVFFRTESGTPVALLDRCPHRFVPLSRGQVVGEQLQCGYHGLRFDAAGACVHNPHGGGTIPDRSSVRGFPVVERYGLIWFWPGDPALARAATIPDSFAVLDMPKFRFVTGYLHVKASYQLIVDNLLDLSHTTYLHPQMAATSAPAAPDAPVVREEFALVRDGDTLWAKRFRNNQPPTDLHRIMGARADRVSARAHMRWFAPGLLFFDLGFVECTPEAADYPQPGTHFVTPETELTSHYFFSQGRTNDLESAEFDKFVLGALTLAFAEQDEPMLEAQQAALGPTADLLAGKPVLLETDAAPLAARRLLDRMIRDEGALKNVAA